jgi:hypothetical protein
MDYNQIPINPYAGAEIQVDASQAPRMIDPNMIDPNMIDPTMIDPTLMNPYAPPVYIYFLKSI